MESRSWLKGVRGIALPFTDECGWLRHPASPTAPFFGQLQSLAKSRSWRLWEVRGGPAPTSEAAPSLKFWSHSLALRPDASAILPRFDGAVRRAIRKAEVSPLTVEISTSPTAMSDFYRLLCLTRRRHGLPPQPASFFQNIQQFVLAAGMGAVVLAKQNQIPVAAAVFMRTGNRAIFKFGASDERFQQFRPNNLVMWRAIEWLSKTGCASLEFGRTSLTNDGLRRYKLGWGTLESPIHYYKYDVKGGAFLTDRDESRGWYNQMFHILPVSVSRIIGKLAYRHMA